jgi:hypothetical protein
MLAEWCPEDDAPWDRLPPALRLDDDMFLPFVKALIRVQCDECYRPEGKGARTVYCDLHRCEQVLRTGTRCKAPNDSAGTGEVFCSRHELTRQGQPA